MKLRDFIYEVREELLAAENQSDPFFELGDVQLEINFALEAKGEVKGKLVVVELGGETTTSQTHKVLVTLKPVSVISEDGKKHARYLAALEDSGITHFD